MKSRDSRWVPPTINEVMHIVGNKRNEYGGQKTKMDERTLELIHARINDAAEKLGACLTYGGEFHYEPWFINGKVQHTNLAVLRLKVEREHEQAVEYMMRNFQDELDSILRICRLLLAELEMRIAVTEQED